MITILLFVVVAPIDLHRSATHSFAPFPIRLLASSSPHSPRPYHSAFVLALSFNCLSLSLAHSFSIYPSLSFARASPFSPALLGIRISLRLKLSYDYTTRLYHLQLLCASKMYSNSNHPKHVLELIAPTNRRDLFISSLAVRIQYTITIESHHICGPTLEPEETTFE